MSLQGIIVLLTTYKYALLFPVAIIEGPIVTVLAGFLSSLGHLNPFIAYTVLVVGDMVGDSIYYTFGYRGGARFLNRWGHYIGLTLSRIEKIETHYAHHAGKTIILGKLAHSLEIPFLVAAGFAKVPYRKFLLYVFIPSVPKSLLFILIGYYLGESYTSINTYLDYTALGAIGLVVVLTAIYFVVRKMARKYQ